jgi:RNA-directed DNA polymerase
MRDEKPQRPRSTAGGTGRCTGNERQAVAAIEESTSPPTANLLEEILQRDNLLRALRRVRSNKGAPGVDGMTIDEVPELLMKEWPRIRRQLFDMRYKPSPVRIVEIPKPGGGGQRMLGIPTVLDRLLQQAILQVIGPIFDTGFSDASYGFRPGRSAHQAVNAACEHIEAGYRWVVDMDLEKFFDRVHHDILMSRVARKIKDKRLLKLIRSFLTAGMMSGGVVSPRTGGVPQGGPLSPLLSNVLLDDLDKELERRGHRFVRYADDCNVYVRSREAGERVMASLIRWLERKLRLKVNSDKSAVDRPWRRKFLGYTVTTNYQPRPKPAPRSVKRFKEKVRKIIRRGRGRSIQEVIEQLNPLIRGWGNYFKLSRVKQPFTLLDQWIRHHLRKVLWLRWKTPKTRCKKLQALGTWPEKAKRATANGRGPWFNAGASHMHAAVPNRLLARWGLESLVEQYRGWTKDA